MKERGDGEGVKEELPIYQVRSNICFWFERKIWLCQGLVSNNQIRMSWLKKKIALTQAHWRHKEKNGLPLNVFVNATNKYLIINY